MNMNFEVLYAFEENDHYRWRVTLEEPTSFNDFVHQLLENEKESGTIVDSSDDFILSFEHGVITDLDTVILGRCGNIQFQIIKCEGTSTERVYTIPLDI